MAERWSSSHYSLLFPFLSLWRRRPSRSAIPIPPPAWRPSRALSRAARTEPRLPLLSLKMLPLLLLLPQTPPRPASAPIGTPPLPSPAITGAAPPSPPLQLPSPWLPPPREEKEESPVTAGASPPRDDNDDGSTHAQATLVLDLQLSRRLVRIRDFLFGEFW